MKSIIKNAAESQVGYKKEKNSKYIRDPEIERMSIEQKDLRLQIEKCQNLEQINNLGNQEKTYSNKVVKKKKDAKEELAKDLVGEIECKR